MLDRPTLPDEKSDDAERAIDRSHNNPPELVPYNEAELAAFQKTAESFVAASEIWNKQEVTTEDLAGQLVDQIAGLRTLYTRIDKARTEAKQPHLDAGKQVDAAFNAIKTYITACADRLKPKLATYTAAKAARLEAERKLRQEEADKAAHAARLLALEAQQSDSIAAQVEAEKAIKDAAKQVKQAAKPVNSNIKSASGAGRTMSARKRRVCEIISINTLFLHFKDDPAVHELLLRLANAEANTKDFAENGTIPGVKITTTTSIA